jgi:nitroreductase
MRTTRRELIQYAGVAGVGLAGPSTDAAVDPAAFAAMFAKRQTVRRYKSDPVPQEHLLQILDAARRGPTCMNQQPWKFLVIRDPKKIAAMRKRTMERLAGPLEKAKPEDREKATRFTEGYFTDRFTSSCWWIPKRPALHTR